MKVVSDEISAQIGNSSWIRRMFDAGAELKKKYGADKVFDFSLGNPDLPQPPAAKAALHALADTLGEPRALGYVGNAGLREQGPYLHFELWVNGSPVNPTEYISF